MNLRIHLLTTLILLVLVSSGQSAPSVPLEIGGFKLGEDINEYPDTEYSTYIKEIVVNDWHGFRRGAISYGICAYPGKIVRIRMKYEDSSKEFYKELLKKFKKQFGKPGEWKGDAFGILYLWKWSFVDSEGRRVSLSLQHNLQNASENIGNQVKLSFPERLEEERLCFIGNFETTKTPEEKARLDEQMQPDWDFMMPR